MAAITTLVRTEWLKMRKYNAFWWILGVVILSYPGINYMLYNIYLEITGQPTQFSQYAKMGIGNPFTFPEAWHTIAYFSSWFVFIPAIVVIMFISNEYTFRTHRQNIIDGWSRKEFVTSKLVDVLLISFIVTVLYVIIALISGFANPTIGKDETWTQAYYTGLFFLQTFSQLSIAFLLGFLIKKAFLSLGIFLCYFLLIENFIVSYLNWKGIDAARFFPLELSDRLIPAPAFVGKTMSLEKYQRSLDLIPQHIILTLVLTAIIWWICYRVNSKRDLK